MMGNGLDRVMQLSSIVDATGNDVDVAAATAAAAQRHVASNAASKGWCSQSDGSVATPDHAHDFHRDDSHSNANDDNDDGGHGLPSSSVNAMHVDTDEDDEDMVFLSGWSRRRSELGKRRRIQELEETDSMADDAASEPAASATTDAADRLVARAGSSKTGYENTRAILLSRLEMLAPTPLYLGDACPLPEPQTAIIASLNADARAMLARSLKSASPDVLLSILVKDIPLKAFDVASTACFEIILRLMPDYGRPNSIRSTYVLTDGQKRAQRDEIASLEADRQRHAILRCSPYVDRWMLLNGMQSWTVKQFTLLYILLFRNVLSKYELFCRQRSSAVNTADAEPTAGLSADDVLQRQLAEKEAIALARRKRRNEMERLRRAAARKARAEAALQQAAANAAGMHSNAMVLHNGVQSHQQQQQQQQQPPPQQQGTANASQANNHNTRGPSHAHAGCPCHTTCGTQDRTGRRGQSWRF
ncbi:hypothetical protein BC831DRAFT_157935 [Entophlyctis helioformis]|nr:hypothetical protein BC831DRAFT_157935 [Entophlyctis helioformis]